MFERFLSKLSRQLDMTIDKADPVHGYRRLEGSLGGQLLNLVFQELALSSVIIPESAGEGHTVSDLPNCWMALSALHGSSRVM